MALYIDGVDRGVVVFGLFVGQADFHILKNACV